MAGLFSTNSDVQQREEIAESDFERDLHRQLQSGMAGTPTDSPAGHELKDDHFDELVEAGIPEDTVFHLRSLLSRDFVLANLSAAEVNEMRWLARNLALRIFALHPSKDSHLTGEFRKFVLDEPNQGLKPLTDSQRAKIHSFIMAYIARVSRSKGGWQQEELSRQYQVSELHTDDSEEDGGWFA